ncbi:ankyrin repeat domain-containing protein [Stieleria sp. JC731]|uniref:ankyrin repeat domain-containing protein n=1 Tax=Pirellulaceae TaxID=2691357 RepID=UPI001E47DD47|nr:ankyrin repeat domain-containing protein [Stieleria sp. JC731]MCC9601802.1 ankyrin repeat domain-containing protein [Stieleria sp. JC731]
MFRFVALTAVFFVLFAAGILLLFSKPAGDGKPESDSAAAAGQESTQVSDSSAEKAPSFSYTPEAFRDAAYEGKLDVVQKCLDEGMDVEIADSLDHTPLIMAAFNGHKKVCKLLLDAGADVNARDREGKGPLYHAASIESPETVTLLLDSGAEINAIEATEQFTPLMVAAAEGNIEVVKVLLKAGADKNMKDVDGDDARVFAAEKNHQEIVDLLAD